MKREVKETITFSPKKNSRSGKSTKRDRSSTKSLFSLKGVTAKKKKRPQTTQANSSVPSSKIRGRKTPKKRSIDTNNPIIVSGRLILRLTVLVVGISTIFGSIIAVANSLNTDYAAENTIKETTQTIATQQPSDLTSLFSVVEVGREITSLKAQLQNISQQYPQLEAGVLVFDTESNGYVDLNATETFSSASTIKLPILIAFFQDVDAEKINLAESLKITKANIAEGSGSMQYEAIGKRFTALKTATEMIATSDNTATNMIVERLGGAEALNQKFREWGLTATKISDRLPDLEGNNTTSAEDLSNLLLKIDRGELVSLHSRDRILNILQQTENNTLLPKGLDKDAAIAHKTGNIKSVLGDTGIVDMPNGKRYIISVLIERPDNDSQAQSLIQQLSNTVYQYFEREKAKIQSQSQTQFQKPRSFLAP